MVNYCNIIKLTKINSGVLARNGFYVGITNLRNHLYHLAQGREGYYENQ